MTQHNDILIVAGGIPGPSQACAAARVGISVGPVMAERNIASVLEEI